MDMSAMWRVSGVDADSRPQSMWLRSADLKNMREAKKRARDEAKRSWSKKGLKVRVVTVECLG